MVWCMVWCMVWSPKTKKKSLQVLEESDDFVVHLLKNDFYLIK